MAVRGGIEADHEDNGNVSHLYAFNRSYCRRRLNMALAVKVRGPPMINANGCFQPATARMMLFSPKGGTLQTAEGTSNDRCLHKQG